MTGAELNGSDWVPGIWAGTAGRMALLADGISMATIDDDLLTPHIATLCSEFWGSRSFHARVFGVPMGEVYLHCWGCRLPTTPSGARILGGASATRKQTERACRRLQALRLAEVSA